MYIGVVNRRKFLRLCAVSAAGAVAAACAPAVPKEVEKIVEVEKVVTAAPAAKEKVELTFSDWNAAANEVLWKEISPIFYESHPHITVNYRIDIGGFEKLLASMVAGTAPDVYNSWGPYVIRFREREQALDLTSYVEKDITQADIDDWNPAQLKAFKWEDKWYALPTYCGSSAIACNLDMFEEAGIEPPPTEWGPGSWTFDKYLEVALKLTKRDASGNITVFGANDVWTASNWQWCQMHLNSWGGHIVDPDDDTRCALGENKAQQAMQWLYDGIFKHRIFPKKGELAELSYVNVFYAQRSAMSWIGAWNLGEAAQKVTSRWTVMPMCMGPEKQTTIVTTDSYLGWRQSKHLDETWELIKFVTSPTYGKGLARTGTLPQPARKSLFPYWYDIMRMNYPKLAEIPVEMFGKCFELGLGDITETFRHNEEAREILIPAWEKVFDLGDGTPADLIAVADQVTKQQQDLAKT